MHPTSRPSDRRSAPRARPWRVTGDDFPTRRPLSSSGRATILAPEGRLVVGNRANRGGGPAALGNPGARWRVAVATVLMQLALGSVNAWSVFSEPLMARFGWSLAAVTLPYTLTSVTLGFACCGGWLLERWGGRRTALAGGLLYGLGVTLGTLAGHGPWVLPLAYGIIGGVGVGIAYIIPLTILPLWFPERRGFATGLAAFAYGLGALFAAPAATAIVGRVGVLAAFGVLGPIYALLVCGASWWMVPPPARPAADPGAAPVVARHFGVAEALRTPQWYGLWAVLFLSGVAGKGLIGAAGPMAREITGAGPALVAALVGLLAVGNAAGRLVWGPLSDGRRLGRARVFTLLFAVQATVLLPLPHAHSPAVFGLFACLIVSCYGGALATTPALAGDYFGAREIAKIYGLLLTATGAGGILGPLLIAWLREGTGGYGAALYVIALAVAASGALPCLLRAPRATAPAPAAVPRGAAGWAADGARRC